MATGRENLVLQGHIYDVTGQRLKRRVDQLLEHFNLTEAANRAVKTYSGGMARKLDIALGLLHEPTVLFLDEPTTGLDPEARAEMWSEISRLTREERMTILLTTHYLEEADELAAELAIVDRGKVVAAGTPDELKSSLHGDSLHIELAAEPADGEVRQALEGVPGLSEIALDGRQLRAQASDGATAMPPLSRPCTRTATRSRSSRCRDRRSTTSTCAWPDATSTRPMRSNPRRARHEARPAHLAHHPALPARVHPPAGLGCDHARPAGHLAAALRGALQERGRHPGLQGRQLHRLPRSGRDRHDGDLLGGVERHGLHRRHGAWCDEPLPASRRSGVPH